MVTMTLTKMGEPGDMKYIHLKPLQRDCSQIVLGSGNFLKPDNYDNAQVMLDALVAKGGNVLDTAHQYRGSEVTIGRWMEERGNRSDIVILTKGAHHDDGSPGPRVNPEAITKDLAESLTRLKTDYVDLYALHRDDLTVEVGPIIEVLNAHHEAGRIRAFGASNWTHERIEEANAYAADHGLVGFSFSSINLSLATVNEARWPGCVSADAETIAWHEATNMPLISWSSQAGGFFSGRFAPDDLSNEEMVRVFYNESNWERLRRAELLGKEKGGTAIQIALAYVLHQPFQTAAILGCETPQELESSLEALNITLSTEEIEWLDMRRQSLAV